MKAKHKNVMANWCFVIFCILTMFSMVDISWAASISGTIFNSLPTPSPLPSVGVQLFTPEGQWIQGLGSCSDPNGDFTILNIPEGKYILSAGGWSCGSPPVYAQTFYSEDESGKFIGTYDPRQAFVFPIGTINIEGKNFYLVPGATISGSVTVSEGNGPGAVNINVQGTNWGYGRCTYPSGNYLVDGLPPDTYRVSAGGSNWCENGQLYKQIFYDNTPDWNLATLLPLLVGEPRTGINFSNLTLDAAISGNVFGHPVMGIQGINVVPGTAGIEKKAGKPVVNGRKVLHDNVRDIGGRIIPMISIVLGFDLIKAHFPPGIVYSGTLDVLDRNVLD